MAAENPDRRSAASRIRMPIIGSVSQRACAFDQSARPVRGAKPTTAVAASPALKSRSATLIGVGAWPKGPQRGSRVIF
jgi:hypothetical protein